MDTILLEMQEELHQFQCIVYEIDMPCIDVDALLSRLFECFANVLLAKANLAMLVHEMVSQGEIFEHIDNALVDNGQEARVISSLTNLATGIMRKLLYLGAYENDKFEYVYRETLNDNTIVLAAIRSKETLYCIASRNDRTY